MNNYGFIGLLASAWVLCKERMQVLTVGVLVFGLITAVLQLMMPSSHQLGSSQVVGVVIGMILSIVGALYYLIAVTQKTLPAAGVASMTGSRLVSYVQLLVLFAVKTWIWIAFVGVGIALVMGATSSGIPSSLGGPAGIVFAIAIVVGIFSAFVLVPRYALASVLWLAEGKDVSSSLRRSYDVTKGEFGTVLGNLIGIGFLSGIVTGVIGAFGAIGGAVGQGVVVAIASQAMRAYSTAFLLQLTIAIVKKHEARPAVPVPPAPAAA